MERFCKRVLGIPSGETFQIPETVVWRGLQESSGIPSGKEPSRFQRQRVWNHYPEGEEGKPSPVEREIGEGISMSRVCCSAAKQGISVLESCKG